MSRDFEELLEQLNAADARYLIGGAHALAVHARPRATRDLDLYVGRTKTNARRVVHAVGAFFGGTAPSYVNEQTLLDPDTIVQLGVAPIRVDFLSGLVTVTFNAAWKRRLDAKFGAVSAHYLSLADLISEKAHFARPQDLVDLQHLRRALKRSGTATPAPTRSRRRKKL